MDDTSLPLQDKLNLETARISWPELERFFARGRVLDVSAELDLLEVASALTEDDIDKFTGWTASKKVQHLQDETAKQWVEDDSNLWAVVIAPWVVVQNKQ
uniref:DUF2288 domain-containing protein n=1 Tax=uncultured Thiotrichaceae bacterium TaxID=298394 RepID=A0A6S6UL75_9GAMM|nr:MAG: Unknown protein [uncultured Thiotrichaceae bacterium]